MGFLSVLSQAQKWIAERAGSGDVVIDATAGNGVDALALAKLVGPKGTLYAFDIQQAALQRTKERLRDHEAEGMLPDVYYFQQSHSQMIEAITSVHPEHVGAAAAVMFNLGYLPGGVDQTVVTETASTITALDAALAILRPRGIITCVLYPGHPGGADEADAVRQWACSLSQAKAQSVIYRQLQRSDSPYLIAIEKKQEKTPRVLD